MLCVFSALFTASAGSHGATGLAGAARQHHHPVSFLSVAGRMVCVCVCVWKWGVCVWKWGVFVRVLCRCVSKRKRDLCVHFM